MIIYQAKAKREPWMNASTTTSTNTSPRASFAGLVNGSESDFSSQEEMSPMLTSGANLMMSGMFHGLPGGQDFSGSHVLGPPEAFYPGSIEDHDEDEDDEEGMLNVQDFIDFGDDSSEDGMNAQSNAEDDAPNSGPITPSPARSRSRATSDTLLGHLGNGVSVTAWSQHQHRVREFLRRPQHTEFMPADSPVRTTSAIKYGRLQAANNTSMTPPRKRKASSQLSRNGTIDLKQPTKRKIQAHKRSKSNI